MAEAAATLRGLGGLAGCKHLHWGWVQHEQQVLCGLYSVARCQRLSSAPNSLPGCDLAGTHCPSGVFTVAAAWGCQEGPVISPCLPSNFHILGKDGQ